ncbi:zinc finger, CCHC-type containing protein [Tanacetum coccineum]
MDSIMGNNTWVLADLHLGCKPLSCKWIFKRKLKVDGTIEKFKARLVIQGTKQKSGIDYFDTYTPVARISTIRLLIAMASIHNLIIHQMDVKTAFLNGDLDKEALDLDVNFMFPNYFSLSLATRSQFTDEVTIFMLRCQRLKASHAREDILKGLDQNNPKKKAGHENQNPDSHKQINLKRVDDLIPNVSLNETVKHILEPQLVVTARKNNMPKYALGDGGSEIEGGDGQLTVGSTNKRSLATDLFACNPSVTPVSNRFITESTTPSTTPIIEKIDRIENLIIDGKVTLLNDEGKPLKKDGYSTQSLLEQLKESYENDEYKYDLYEDDMYEGYEIPNKIQAICDYLDIKVRGQPLKRLDLRSKTLVKKLPGNYPSINELNITSDGVMGAFPSVSSALEGTMRSKLNRISIGGMGLFIFSVVNGGAKAVRIGATKVSISYGENLSDLTIEASSSHWTWQFPGTFSTRVSYLKSNLFNGCKEQGNVVDQKLNIKNELEANAHEHARDRELQQRMNDINLVLKKFTDS